LSATPNSRALLAFGKFWWVHPGMSRKRKIIFGCVGIIALLLVGAYFYLTNAPVKYTIHGTRYRVQESRFLTTSFEAYLAKHGGVYPAAKDGDLWEVVKALEGSPDDPRPPNTSGPHYDVAATWFMDYDGWSVAHSEVEKFGRISADKFAFTYIDGLTTEDRSAILLYYKRSTFAKDQHAYDTQPNGPPIQGRLVVYAGVNDVEFIPEEKFQAQLAATLKLVAKRKAKAAVSAPAEQ
jgi:hypothetical protein